MKIWIDAQLAPAIAVWISRTFAITAVAIRDLGLRDANDKRHISGSEERKRRRHDEGQ
jgi:predicted nuclease of predicted toxin-antitoxin system